MKAYPKPSRAAGFTLTELLITTSLIGVVMIFIGSTITSQIRQNTSQETRHALAEEWARTAEFIESDLFIAERTYVVDGTTSGADITSKLGNTCDFSSSNIKMALVFNDSTSTAIYSVEPLSASESQKWIGPYALKRCGPLNTTTGDVTGPASSAILVGSLQAINSFTASRGLNSLGGAKAARDVSLNLQLNANGLTHTGTFGGQARVSPSYNLIRDEITTGSSCGLSTSETALLCGTGTLEFNSTNCPEYKGNLTASKSVGSGYNCGLSRVRQFYPTGSATINGTTEGGKEDAVFLNKNRNQYTISGNTSNGTTYPCSRTLCVVSGDGKVITINNGDVLVFADQELRI